MSLSNVAFKEKYRAKELKGMILLDRIRKVIGTGELKKDFLFYSSKPGLGKTTLAQILAAPYQYVKYNISEDNGVDFLRNEIKNFCEETPLFEAGSYRQKVVILDEFDYASASFLAAFRGLSEKYDDVRFIATCNYINKLPDNIISRFTPVNFIPENKEEEEELIRGLKKKSAWVFKKNNVSIDDEILDYFVRKNAPDMRSILDKIQDFCDSGETEVTEENIKSLNYSFSNAFDEIIKKPDPIKNFEFFVSNFSSKTDELLNSLGNEFIDWIKDKNDLKLLGKVPFIIRHVAEYQYKRNFVIDPVVNMLACVYEIQESIHE